MPYAEQTSVSVEKSKAEIESTLQRYGAEQFMHGWDAERAIVQFSMNGKYVRFILPLPDRSDPKFWSTPAGRRRRDDDAAYKAWEQACRQKWRALALVVKAKLEAVESGITEFEDEFLAHIVLPNGQTTGQWIRPQIDEAYSVGKMPDMLAIEGPKKR